MQVNYDTFNLQLKGNHTYAEFSEKFVTNFKCVTLGRKCTTGFMSKLGCIFDANPIAASSRPEPHVPVPLLSEEAFSKIPVLCLPCLMKFRGKIVEFS